MIWKMSPLVEFELLGAFVKTSTADDKYPFQVDESFQLPI